MRRLTAIVDFPLLLSKFIPIKVSLSIIKKSDYVMDAVQGLIFFSKLCPSFWSRPLIDKEFVSAIQ